MTCHYCRAQNEDDAHRCHRCGRRLNDGGLVAATRTAVAPQLQPYEAPAEAKPSLQVVPRPAEPQRVEPAAGPGVQASLFGPMPVARSAAAPKPQRAAQPRNRREKVEHPTLDFGPDTVRTLKTSVAAAIYSDAPVAIASFRATAAVIDTIIGLIGTVAFVGTFRAFGFQFDMSRESLLTLGLATLLIGLLYRVMFALGNGDTLGLRMTNLRLVDFYGHLPSRKARLLRLFGGLVSFAAAGMPLLWGLFDEERLTWHDHISKTFPTMPE